MADGAARGPGRGERVAVFGGALAGGLGRALVRHGFAFLVGEPGPPRLSAAERAAFGYAVHSARTGPATLDVLDRWFAAALAGAPLDAAPVHADGRFLDPLRPAIEPAGFASPREALLLREVTVGAIARVLAAADAVVIGVEAEPSGPALSAVLSHLKATPVVLLAGPGSEPLAVAASAARPRTRHAPAGDADALAAALRAALDAAAAP